MWKKLLIPIALCALFVWAKLQSNGMSRTDLIGRWSATDRPFQLEFLADGRCSLATIGPPRPCTFVLDDGTLDVFVTAGPHIRARAELRGDKLDLFSDGTHFLFDRVR